MENKIYCPVCQISFLSKEQLKPGMVLICPICGAKVEITAVEPEIQTQKLAQEPKDEIYERVNTYAQLRNYVFNEDKELIMEGLLSKKEKFGDFYCPCRFDNIPENLCPCLETRQGAVRRDGRCLCGLYYKE